MKLFKFIKTVLALMSVCVLGITCTKLDVKVYSVLGGMKISGKLRKKLQQVKHPNALTELFLPLRFLDPIDDSR